MKFKGGYTNYGQTIGILMLDTIFPRLPGDIGNAETFDFPVKYKIVKGARPNKIMGSNIDSDLLEPFIKAAQELESEGIKAITTSCGFLAPYQKYISNCVNVPVFTSSLILVPLIRNIVNPNQKIGIFTERSKYLTEEHFLGVGWSSYDIPVIIKGMKEDAIFPSVFIGNKPDLDLEILNYEIKEMTEEFITENPDARAIVLECTNMCPFTRMIHDISGLPVFDINNLVNFIHYSVKPRKYII